MGLAVIVPISMQLPAWRDLAGRLPFAAPLRMIDGLPAFPDEEPPADWRELRAALPAGMITLRRVPAGVELVTWENASPELVAQREQLAAAIQAGQEQQIGD